ncbi:Hypothetical Protein FCC1311_063352 [Hondaea fermentalgiana]|uniref:Uncharacterized protein n=1 Tax=Hondaea fermentalgiana TaxID=2315210 RepID=A0A2R5GHP9_9STRA|nr:Hypothetical Protein FCC1311_063352 [Hondaea fermentalgiana]|eukprot:GBG30115.1 Hypothetical Protein FCC1311_063352 [Hondaea fermentalgiana]
MEEGCPFSKNLSTSCAFWECVERLEPTRICPGPRLRNEGAASLRGFQCSGRWRKRAKVPCELRDTPMGLCERRQATEHGLVLEVYEPRPRATGVAANLVTQIAPLRRQVPRLGLAWSVAG